MVKGGQKIIYTYNGGQVKVKGGQMMIMVDR